MEVVVLFGGMPDALIRKEQRQSSNLQDPLTGTVDVDGIWQGTTGQGQWRDSVTIRGELWRYSRGPFMGAMFLQACRNTQVFGC